MPKQIKKQADAPTGPRLVKRTAANPKPSVVQPDLTHEQIAMRAYEFFQREGGVHGQHVDHWLRAERELMAFTQQPPKRAAATRARG
jgi:Protein of unknown function (DUF2934)